MSKSPALPKTYPEEVQERWTDSTDLKDLPGEVWKAVYEPPFDDYYEVSNMGRVKALSRETPAGFSGTRRTRERILKPYCYPGRFPTVSLNAEGLHPNPKIHTLVLEAFVGPANGRWACLIDNDKMNPVLSNLCYGTPKEVHKKQDKFGTRARGEKHGAHTKPEKWNRGENVHCSKLTEKDVRLIRILLHNRTSVTKLAERFGVTRGAIYQIKNKESWRHVA